MIISMTRCFTSSVIRYNRDSIEAGNQQFKECDSRHFFFPIVLIKLIFIIFELLLISFYKKGIFSQT
jgi:hypothetical protein